MGASLVFLNNGFEQAVLLFKGSVYPTFLAWLKAMAPGQSPGYVSKQINAGIL
jgi:hypothetical protein